MNVGSLFAGVGGLDLTLERRGHEVVWQVENDPACAKVLARHWPGVPNFGDVTAIEWDEVPRVDIICGGFPCQDLSYAGRGAGITPDTRSGLWFRMWDAVRHLRPRYVVVENVRALLVRGARVTSDLAALGYVGRWGVVRASDAGAPHQRARVFIVARDAERSRLEGTGVRRAAPERRGDAAHAASEGWRAVGDAIGGDGGGAGGESRPLGELGGRDHAPADATSERRQRGPRGLGTWRLSAERGEAGDHARHDHRAWGAYWPAIARWERVTGEHAPAPLDGRGRLNGDLSRWMMGLPAGWLDGMTRTQKLRTSGSAVVWQQAALALDLLGMP